MEKSLTIQNTTGMPLLPSQAEWEMIKEQATIFVKTGFLPAAVKTPEQAIAIAIKGREIGVPMMQAFSHISVINGKPSISAELMLALIYKNCRGAVVEYLQSSNDLCVVEARRPGGKKQRFTFSIDDAKRAGLAAKENWVKYPAAMLRARAVSAAAHAVFPDAIMGIESNDAAIPETADCEPVDVTAETTTASITKPKELTRKELGIEIDKCIKALKLPEESVAQLLQEEFKKKSNDLSDTEMGKLLAIMQAEMAKTGTKAI